MYPSKWEQAINQQLGAAGDKRDAVGHGRDFGLIFRVKKLHQKQPTETFEKLK